MRIFVLFLLCFSALARSETVSFHLDHIPVIELAQLIYSDVSKTNYAIDSSVLDMKNSVSVHFSDLDQKQAVSVLETLLQSSGVEILKSGKVVLIRAVRDSDKIEPEEEIFFYRPRFRTVSYITDLCSGLFKNARFSGQRRVATPVQNVVPASGVSAPAVSSMAAPKSKQPVDNGTNAYSQQSKDQDSFFFIGSLSDVEKLKKLLVQVDVSAGEVFVKGMVYEVTTSEKDGSAFSLALKLMQGKLGVNIGKISVGDSISFKNASIDAVFSALSTDSRFKSVSNPSLRVKSGASARFSVGSDVPVLGAVQLDKNGNPVQSVEYKPSGVIFDLQPQIRESVIDLTINQQLSSFIPTTTGVNNSPTLIKREISTSIGAANDDVIVLGGLDEDKNSQDASGFSFFPAWLKSRGGESSKTQILLVLQVQKI